MILAAFLLSPLFFAFPRNRTKLLPAAQCIFNDAEWLPGAVGQDVDGWSLVHEKVSNAVAHSLGLGVRGRVQALVEKVRFQEAIDITRKISPFVSPRFCKSQHLPIPAN